MGPSEITSSYLRAAWTRTKGKAWEPPNLKHPHILAMIEGGFIRRCDMRWGFECTKDAGVTWTEAGKRAALAAMAEQEKVTLP